MRHVVPGPLALAVQGLVHLPTVLCPHWEAPTGVCTRVTSLLDREEVHTPVGYLSYGFQRQENPE